MTQQQIKGATGALGSDGSLDVYDVPGSVIVTPYSVSATFDGSGAGGTFLPCLTFKTQTGAVIARCPAPEVASGDAAEVSWFPHVATASSGPPPPASSLLRFAFIGQGPLTSCPQNATTPLSCANPAIFGGFYTNDATSFASASTVISGNTYYGLNLLTQGHIIFAVQFLPSGLATVGTEMELVQYNGNDGDPSGDQYGRPAYTSLASDSTPNGQILTWIMFETVGDGYTPPLGAVVFGIKNGAPGAAVSGFVSMWAIKLDDDNTFIG